MFSVRTKILIVALASMLAAMSAFTTVTVITMLADSRSEEAAALTRDAASYGQAMWIRQRGCEAILQAVAWRPDVRNAIVQSDRDLLLSLLQPTFQDLRRSFGIVQMYVHRPDGFVLLRVDSPDSRGDSYVSHRPMIVDAMRRHTSTYGIELAGGRMSHRTVVPVMEGPTLVGLLEVGVDYDVGLLDQLKMRYGEDSRIWLSYTAAGPSGLWPDENVISSPDGLMFLHISTFGTGRMMPAEAYTDAVGRNRTSVHFIRDDSGNRYGAIITPITGYDGTILGALEVQRSRAASLAAFRRSLLWTIGFATAVAAAGIVGLSFTLRAVVLRPLRRLTMAAKRQYEGDLAARVDYTAGDEFGMLAQTFDGLSNRLTETMQQQSTTIEQLDAARHSAEQANAAKDQFLAALSHELRTPLTPSLLSAEALQNDPSMPEHLKDDVRTIRRNVELEARLIDDLLDLTRISKGKLELHMDARDAHVLLQAAIAVCYGDIGLKRLKLRTDFAASRRYVYADAARLQQVFWNLVKNAVKFTPVDGEVTISTRNETRDGKDLFVLDVTDTGIGMDQDTLSRIFKYFEQGSRTITRTFGGLGLGLAISRRITEMHGGSISAHSQGTGKGSCFQVTLPAVPAPVQAGSAAQKPSPEPMPSMKILLVEDHMTTGQAVSRLLRKLGHLPTLATNLADAKKFAAASEFDLVISDLGLPDGHGYDLMTELRSKYGLRGIAVSGYGMQEDIKRSMAAGFSQHLTKPITAEQLRDAILEIQKREPRQSLV